MLDKMLTCANWALNNQEENGEWNTFFFKDKENPYSSMAQGEGASLLLRAFLETKEEKYLDSATKAINFMLVPINNGGTSLHDGENFYLYEFTSSPLVLNGWIFSIWGLYDYIKLVNDEYVKQAFDKSISTLSKVLPKFDSNYWSKYDLGKRIASPFYHKLHIAQLHVMYDITKIEVFKEYALKWEKYQKNFFKRNYAFIKKVFQKIFEK